MNLKRRALIFVTFFLSCLAIALLGASLGTKAWISASCHRDVDTVPNHSNGTVTFGLFEYQVTTVCVAVLTFHSFSPS
jgi:hypothetical protein